MGGDGGSGVDGRRSSLRRARVELEPAVADALEHVAPDSSAAGAGPTLGRAAAVEGARPDQMAYLVVSHLALAHRLDRHGRRTPPPGSDAARTFLREAVRAVNDMLGRASAPTRALSDAVFADADARRAGLDLWHRLGRGDDARVQSPEAGFEELITPEGRRHWGQVYTPPDVAAAAADWAVRRPTDTVFDPACGTGRFLTAATRRLEHLCDVDGEGDGHGPTAGSPPDARRHTLGRRPTSRVYGVEREPISASLAATAGAAASLDAPGGGRPSCPNVAVADFFETRPGASPPGARFELPATVDAVLMNPPYTRHEGLDEEYAAFVRETALAGYDDPPNVGKSAGYYAYFLFHAAKFLPDGGRLGAVVPTSWLDADYGAGVQQFLLDEFRIDAVVHAGADRLVRTADVNAVLLLLERECDPTARADNRAKFVTLRRPVTAFRAASSMVRESDRNEGNERDDDGDNVGGGHGDQSDQGDDGNGGQRAGGEFDRLFRRVRSATERYGGDLRVVSRRQTDLRRRGEGATTYTGGKWGPYVRAPDVYWRVRDARGDLLTTFADLADDGRGSLAYGTRSGAPDFFYLPNDHHAVERDGDTLRVLDGDGTAFELPRRYWMHRVGEGPTVESSRDDSVRRESVAGDGSSATDDDEWVPNYLLKRSRGIDRLRFSVADLSTGDDLRYVLRFEESRTELHPDARAYVEWGESHDVTACDRCHRTRRFPAYCPGDPWYDVTPHLTAGTILPNKDTHVRHAYWTADAPVWIHQSLYGVVFDGDTDLLSGLLNSTFGLLMLEVAGRVNLGEGALDLMTADHRSVPFPDPDRLTASVRRSVGSRFRAMANRPAGTVFEELGAKRRASWSLSSVRDDRRALDAAVMGDALELSTATQAAVYRGLLELVRVRLDKAASGTG